MHGRGLRTWSKAWLSCAVLSCWLGCSGSSDDDPSKGRTGTGGVAGFGAQAGTSGWTAGTYSVAGTTGGGGAARGGNTSDVCADANVHTNSTTPIVMFVVDGSGSMCAPFGGPTRWQALRNALLEPNEGLIYRLERTVYFGMMLYDGTIDPFLALTGAGSSPNPPCATMYVQTRNTGSCPQLITFPPAQNAAAAIDAMYPAVELGGSTPTDRAMEAAVDQLLAMRSTDPDAINLPQYIILATDGQPNDICIGGAGGDTSAQKQGVIAAVDRAAANNITTFVISVAGNDPGLQAHLEEVAKHGQPGNPNAVTFNPSSQQDLVNTLAALLGGAIGCDIVLNGKVTVGQECSGTVTSNGTPLPCCSGGQCGGVPTDPPNGWVLKDPSTISLVGRTCTDFLTAPQVLLSATFPCGVFIPD